MDNCRLCSDYYFFWRLQSFSFADSACEEIESKFFSDGKSTHQFLEQFKNNPYAMSGLRALLSESRRWTGTSRLTADQTLAEVGRLILSGELGVALRPRAFFTGSSSVQRTGDSAPLPAAAPLSAPRFEQPDPPTFSSGLNAAAQAAALSAAAASGAAFCPH